MAQENENKKPQYMRDMSNLDFIQNFREIITNALTNAFIPKVGVMGDFSQIKNNMRADVNEFLDNMAADTRNLEKYGAALDALKKGNFVVLNVRSKNSYGRVTENSFAIRLTGRLDKLYAALVPVDRSMPISEHPYFKELDPSEQNVLMEYGLVGTPGTEPGTIGNIYMKDESINTIFKVPGEAIAETLSRTKGKFFGQELTNNQQAVLQHLGAIALNREHSRFAIFSARDESLVEVNNENLLKKLQAGESVNLVPNGAFVAKKDAQERTEERRTQSRPKPTEPSENQEQTASRGRRRQ